MTIAKTVNIADNAAVAKFIKTAGNNVELLQYGQAIHNQNIKKNHAEDVSVAAMDAISDSILTAQYIENKRQVLLDALHQGKMTPAELDMLKPGYFIYLDSLVQKGLQELSEQARAEKLGQLVMVYDINNDSEFVRGYLSQGKALNANHAEDKAVIDVVDQAFHSWLVANKMTNQDGVIYSTEQLDKAGNPINRVDPEVLSARLSDPVDGLHRAIKKHDKRFELEVRQHQAAQKTQQAPQTNPEPGA